MNNEAPAEMTVKEKYEDCKGFECPRLNEILQTGEDGTKYFTEGDMAYRALVLCNNWAIGWSDGECPIKPLEEVGTSLNA